MAIHQRQSKKIIKNVRQEDAPGIRMDVGPHIGIVKHVTDPLRTGGLMVYLPFLGGDPDDVHNQRFVQYASPFFGHTNLQEGATRIPNEKNSYETVRHSYGMFFTPPDVGVKVLCIFVNGDANNGFWFACIPPSVEHNMLASAGGRSTGNNLLVNDPFVQSLITGYGAKYAPAVEYNAAADNAFGTDVLFNPIAPHRIQTKILAEQGLLGDTARGIDGEVTTRESPSGVFGITTPGRTFIDQTTDDYLQRVSVNPIADVTKIKERVDFGRKGGHQFVMDDGDKDGNARRVKMRTAAGHQIVMDDTNGFIYISNSTGKAWVELTNDGQMLMYLDKGASLRYKGDLNVKVDGDYNLDVSGNYNMNVAQQHKTESATREEIVTGTKQSDIRQDFGQTVGGTYAVDVSARVGITAGDALIINSLNGGWEASSDLKFEASTIDLNSGPPAGPATPAVPSIFTKAALAEAQQASGVWSASGTQDPSIVTASPTHEPYNARLTIVTPLVSSTGQPSKKV